MSWGEEYVRRTRSAALLTYAAFAIVAAGLLAAAVAVAARRGAEAWTAVGIGVVVGGVAALALFALGRRRQLSPRRSLTLSLAVGAVCGVAVPLVGPGLWQRLGGDGRAGLLGLAGGYAAAAILGIADARRRLAHDPALAERARQLGWDPEHPFRSYLGRGSPTS